METIILSQSTPGMYGNQLQNSWTEGFESPPYYNMKKKDYHKPGYWKDWYWNKGGREKVQATRYIAEYEREKKNRVNNVGLNPT